MTGEDEYGETRPQSKFEWRPGDVEILSDKDAAVVLAEYAEWLKDRGKNDAKTEPGASLTFNED